MTDASRAPRPFRILAAVTFGVGVAMLVLAIVRFPQVPTLGLALLMLSAIVSENYSLQVSGYTWSLAYPLTMSALLLQGPLGAGLVAAVSAVRVVDLRIKRPSINGYNFGQLVLVSCASGAVYLALGGRTLYSTSMAGFVPLSAQDFPRILVPLSVAAAVFLLSNLLLTAVGVGLLKGMRPTDIVRALSGLVPSLFALAFVGYLIADVLAVNVIAFPLFVFPLVVARQLYQRYTNLREAYVDTVRSLVGALEAKDPYTRGHSERVASYGVALGASLGLDGRAIQRLEYAALLHDLGKLRVSHLLLAKPGSLTKDEYLTIQEHPVMGAEMVSMIPPLKDLAEYVRLHHERWDGTGYPSRIEAEQIPLFARVLSVADAYDAMTTTRPYRPALSHEAAVAELIQGAGRQFDPELVRSFIEARLGQCAVPVPVAEAESSGGAMPVGEGLQ